MVLRLCGRGQVREWVGDMIASAPPAKPLANMSGTAPKLDSPSRS
jgi:hypothetical protein